MKVAWQILIRFVSTDDKILYGEPILPSPDFDLGKVTEKDELKAKIIEGDDLYDLSGKTTVSNDIATVKRMLGPLAESDVPIVRCIGLNYAKHSTYDVPVIFRIIGASNVKCPLLHLSCTDGFQRFYKELTMSHLLLVREAGRNPPPFPSLFFKPSTTVQDHDAPIIVPKIAQDEQADYEGELVSKFVNPKSSISMLKPFKVSNHRQRRKECT